MIHHSKHVILHDKTVRDALIQISKLGTSPLILFVTDENGKVLGSLTDGDIRKGLVSGTGLNDSIIVLMNRHFKYLLDYNDFEQFDNLKKADLKIIPLVNENFQLIELLDLKKTKAILPVDAVIMAGGKGVRLKPYTDTMPKPMLEVGDKPILAHNIDRLIEFGIKNIHISVNYLREQIIEYVQKHYSSVVNISFIEENEPLGTVGSVKLVPSFGHDDILVMNADILTNIDYLDFYKAYKSTGCSMSVSTFSIRINIPYGVLDIDGNFVKSLVEKPSYTYYSNAGIYLFNKEVLNYIPDRQFYDMPDLMEAIIHDNKQVSHFLIRGYWLDIGNVQNYAKAQEDIKFIKF